MKRSHGHRLLLGARHRDLGHGLAEGDGGGLDDAAAGRQIGSSLVAREDLADRVELVAMAAVEAGRVGGVAVQLDDLVVGHAGAPGAGRRRSG